MLSLDLCDVHPNPRAIVRTVRPSRPILGFMGDVGELLVVAITCRLRSLDASARGQHTFLALSVRAYCGSSWMNNSPCLPFHSFAFLPRFGLHPTSPLQMVVRKQYPCPMPHTPASVNTSCGTSYSSRRVIFFLAMRCRGGTRCDLIYQAGHSTLSPHMWVNHAIGYTLHCLVLVPYYGWRYSHNMHRK